MPRRCEFGLGLTSRDAYNFVSRRVASSLLQSRIMTDLMVTTTPVLAAGWSLLYLLFGGGIGGAIVIFLGLKALGR